MDTINKQIISDISFIDYDEINIDNDNLDEHIINIQLYSNDDKNTKNEINTNFEENKYLLNYNENYNSLFNSLDVQTNYIHSNSPITITENSNSNSDSENSNNSDINSDLTINSDDDLLKIIRNERIKNQISTYHKKSSFKKKAYEDIEKSLCKYYDYDNKYSSKLDILITFMKGQKNIYMQSKYNTQRKLNCLMIPILCLSAGMAIFAPFIKDYEWGGGLISGLNIIITTFVSLMNYMKYETHTEMFLQIANHYDKMEISLEMSNSQLLFIDKEEEKNEMVLNKLKEIEIKMNEMKEVYNILIPEQVKNIFPIICNINILSLIKKMEVYRKSLINKFKDVKNEIRYIIHKWRKDVNNNLNTNIDQTKEKNRLLFLYDIKEKIKIELMESKKIYDYVDEIFTKEIKNAEYNKNMWFCFWNKKTIEKENIHPVLNKHFHFIFEDL